MEKLKRFISAEIVLALLMIICYFLPWVDFGIFKITGWEIPTMKLIKIMDKVGDLFSKQQSNPYKYHVIYIIPSLSILSALFWILVKKKVSRILLFINGIVGIGLSLYFFITMSNIGKGIYLLLLISIISVVYTIFQLKKSKKDIIENNPSIEVSGK